ncbi:MAG: 23S rRNA (guanosine(2251)-2'-O)-methyltransferase RlmB [Termitinemataceae bacterium]|nr:MAG: 23S rRNA (guanosine(2251)-2'-O)-methyltransferase RlmB [Termitinemataceae bacterium]
MIYLTSFHAIEEQIRVYQTQGRPASSAALLCAKPGPRAREIADLARSCGILIKRVGTHDLDRIKSDHKGMIMELEELDASSNMESVEDFLALMETEEYQNKKNISILILDEITDPHNFGAILRSCDQFEVDVVITRNKRTAKHSDVIAASSAGAAAWVPVISVPNLPRAVEALKEAGFWIYGADSSGEPIHKQKLTGKLCIILGSEGSGLSRLLKEECDGLLSIPTKGKIDSLNVSVAAGVVLYEIMRQRCR